jgi:integrase
MAQQITGHVRLENRKSGRVWVAKYARAEGTPTRKVLGRAWAKDSGRSTARGAPVWRVADGPKPDGYLTPKEADAELAALLAAERGKPHGHASRSHGKTFGQATAAYLVHVERVKKIAPSTLSHYRSITRAHLLPAFGEDTPLRRLTPARIEAFREGLLTEDRLSRSAMRQVMNVLNGILTRAQRQGWISHNPAVDVEPIPMPRSSGDFNVLTTVQVEAVARAAAEGWTAVEPGTRTAGGRTATRVPAAHAKQLTRQRQADAELYAAAIRFAAHSGLRLGELRALRWRDVRFDNAVVHVRRNAPTSAPAAVAEKAPKSGRVRSVPLTDDAARTLDALSRRERFTGSDDYVFPSPTGAIIDGGKVRDSFYEGLKAAGLGHLREKEDPLVFHDLRHTFGTLAVRVAPVTDVKEWMGHADLSTTMRYVHHVPRHDAARRLSEAFAVETTSMAVEQDPAPAGPGS